MNTEGTIQHVAITGANGFIGEALTNFFLDKGIKVTALTRKKITQEHHLLNWQAFDLNETADFNLPQDVEAIVHCAFVVYSEEQKDADEINIRATKDLAAYAASANKQFVFLSSFSAHSEALSHYGKHKFELEKFLAANYFVIKPGLVMGKRGLYNNMAEAIRHKKFFPVIDKGNQPLQIVRVEELCVAIDNGLQKKLKGVFPLASVKVFTYLAFCEAIAKKLNRAPFFVFVPSVFLKVLMVLAGKRIPFTKENLYGLLQLKSVDTKESNRLLGVEVNEEV